MMTITQIDKYQIITEVGRGGFATVYLAQDTHTSQRVALKVLSPHVALDDKQVRRFEREAQALTKLNQHPHIITIYDYGEADGEIYLAMEYFAGGSLREYLRTKGHGYLSTGQIFTILEQLAQALDYAHAQGMIHRDIKPDNVLLDDAGQPQHVVLTDFGLVKYPLEDESLTLTSMVLGTRGYIAPEQLIGTIKEVTPVSDVYSFSALAYQLFTGELPPLLSEPRNPLEINPTLTESVVKGLSKGLAKHPEERPPSAGALIALLKAEQPPVILVVDDDKNMRRTIQHILRRDYAVEAADGVETALTALRRRVFDLLIVDLNMAGNERAGFELLQTVNQQYPNLHKIILTAKYDLPSVTEGYDYGLEAYVPKDQNMAANLLQKVGRTLGS